MVRKKPKSKRLGLHQKYKIDKKIKEHHRKARREERKNPSLRKKLKKDPGIPNSWPFKEEFLQKMEIQKAKVEAEQAKQKQARLKEQMKRRSLPAIAQDASARSKAFELKEKDKVQETEKRGSMFNIKDGSKRAYYKEFRKIIESADVILEVLDARDPMGCRCTEVEKRILAKDPNKKIILVVNKIDLVPRDNVEQWLKFLRNEYPAIAFKCSTQEQKKHLAHSNMSTNVAPSNILDSSECLGADTLLQLLKNYSRNLNLKTAVTVGIIGYPNVGKSSIINSLKRSKAVGVGATPGFTKTVQEIILDKNVKLLDCPGIVFGNSSENDVVLRNCVKIEQVPDPVEPVETILKRCNKAQILELYRIGDFQNVTEFLTVVAAKRGKLIKGGRADLLATARSILQDWNGGRIPFYTIPPAVKGVHIGASIVNNWGKEFDLETVFEKEKSTVFANLPSNNNNSLAMTPGSETVKNEMFEEQMDDEGQFEEGEEGEDEEGEDMEDEEPIEAPKMVTFQLPEKKVEQKSKAKDSASRQNLSTKDDLLNPQVNKLLKKQQKRLKKDKKKTLTSMEDDEGNMGEDDDYNFASDFIENSELKGRLSVDDDDDLELDDI